MARPGRPSTEVDAWGIMDRYLDVKGRWHATPPRSRERLLAAMGIGPDGADTGGPGAFADVIVCAEGAGWTADGPGEVRLEDGSTRTVAGAEQVAPPVGYHAFTRAGAARPVRLIVSPASCYLPDDLRTWGWAVQLYASRSRRSWGIGDLADLRQLATWARRLGAGVLLVNPVVTPFRSRNVRTCRARARDGQTGRWPSPSPSTISKVARCRPAWRAPCVRAVPRPRDHDTGGAPQPARISGKPNRATRAACPSSNR